MGFKVDFSLVAGEAQGEPLLLLARPAARDLRAGGLGREVVGDPVLGGGQQVGGADPGLLQKFAAGGGFPFAALDFIRIDAALG